MSIPVSSDPFPKLPTPTAGSPQVDVLIECLPTSSHRYTWDRDIGLMRLHSGPQVLMLPIAIGRVPNTMSGTAVAKLLSQADRGTGLPMSAFLMCTRPIEQIGVLAAARMVGAIPMSVDGCADDRLLCVLCGDPWVDRTESVIDIPGTIIEKLQLYLETCEPDRYIHVGEPVGVLLAQQLLDASLADFTALRDVL